LEIQIFFKTSSSSKEALSKVLKPPLSTLEVYKERSSVGSSLNTPLEFFNNTLKTNQRYSSKHQITRIGFQGIQIFFKTLSLSLQARKLSLKEFSSLLHLRLKFNKNEALLDQAKTPHKSSSTTL
jgi:hypothetical protein